MAELLGSAANSMQGTARQLSAGAHGMADRIMSPAQRDRITAQAKQFGRENPGMASFLLAQVALSALPIVLFVAFTISVAVFALVVALILALLWVVLFVLFVVGLLLAILFPTLLMTTFAAVSLWVWGWGAYFLLCWFRGEGLPGFQGGFTSKKTADIKKVTGNEGSVSGDATLEDKKSEESTRPRTEIEPQQEKPKINGQRDGHEEPNDPLRAQGGSVRKHPGHRVPQGARNVSAGVPSEAINETVQAPTGSAPANRQFALSPVVPSASSS